MKKAHDEYGLKVQLNLFYRTDSFYGNDEFCLSEVPDTYKNEWEESSDWLTLAFHAKEEFPDYPHVNARYEDTKAVFKAIEKEVFRFAGKKSFAYVVCPHWLPMSRDGVKALADCGVKLLDATFGDSYDYDGNPDSLPYGHALRLLNNRQPETKIFSRRSRDVAIARSICCHNHVCQAVGEKLLGTIDSIFDEETGLRLKPYKNVCLNHTPYDELDGDFAPFLENDYIGVNTHEQYFYSDYLAYQPDYMDKIFKMCEILTANGFEFIDGNGFLD